MERQELKLLQMLPLEIKIAKTKLRVDEVIRQYGISGVYASFSGGKDSTVLLDIIRELYPQVQGVYVDTGLEYPEVKKFVKTKENITILRPNVGFKEVLIKYGYPVVSKEQSQYIYDCRNSNSEKLKDIRINGNKYGMGKVSKKWLYLIESDFRISDKCCNVMKKAPVKKYEHETGRIPIIGTMASESMQRERIYLKNGCNAFEAKRPKSTPLGFWTEQDILQYIQYNNLEIPSVYGEIVNENGLLKTTKCDRTGCMYCAFGCHRKGDNRFERLSITHPQIYQYCMNGGEYDKYGMWIPNNKGLGLSHVLDAIGVGRKENNKQIEGQTTIDDFI